MLSELSVSEFLLLQQENKSIELQRKKYVYGINGIAELFHCSIPTANRIKKSGKINGAITQIGRKIIVDAALAIELAGQKKGGRS